jgi:ABC-type nitrate/sulfonate/bicarbonate transport system substrate-binding protein
MTDRTQTQQLRLGVFTTASIVAIAEGRGLFASNGITLSVEEVEGSGAQMQGLRDGHFHVVHTSPDNVMKSRLGGDDVFVFFVLDSGLPQLLVGRQGLPQLHGQVGVRVGVDDPASGFAFVVYELLRENGVDPNDCEIVSVGSSRQRLDALRAGDIDVGLLSAAMSGRIQEGGMNVIANAADAVPWYPGVAAATSRAVAEGQPEVLASYSAALHGAMRWAQSPGNADAAVALVSSGMGLSHDEAAAVLLREAIARTNVLPDVAAASDAIAKVADLRELYTGVRAEGAFDDRWMSALGTGSE